jgi:hypothetical protein
MLPSYKQIRVMIIAAIFMFVVAMAMIDMAEAADETDAPRAAVLITSCHEIVAVMMVTPDNRIVVFDSSSEISADTVKALASRAEEPARVCEVGCPEKAE